MSIPMNRPLKLYWLPEVKIHAEADSYQGCFILYWVNSMEIGAMLVFLAYKQQNVIVQEQDA